MGKKRKNSSESEDRFKMKISSNANESILVTFPSGYKPGNASETLHAFDHAENKSGVLVLTTVC